MFSAIVESFEQETLSFAGLVAPAKNVLQLRFTAKGQSFDLRFAGVKELHFEGNPLQQPNQYVALQTLSTSHPLLLNFGPWSSIFGNAPLPDPPKFLFDFCRLAKDEFGINREPLDYLHFEKSLGEWRSYVYSRAFTLLNAPTVLAEATRDILDRQAAEYTILPDPERTGEGELAVFEFESGISGGAHGATGATKGATGATNDATGATHGAAPEFIGRVIFASVELLT